MGGLGAPEELEDEALTPPALERFEDFGVLLGLICIYTDTHRGAIYVYIYIYVYIFFFFLGGGGGTRRRFEFAGVGFAGFKV